MVGKFIRTKKLSDLTILDAVFIALAVGAFLFMSALIDAWIDDWKANQICASSYEKSTLDFEDCLSREALRQR